MIEDIYLFKRGDGPCTIEFREVKIKRQLIDHYLKGKCNITQQYGIYTIEINSPNTFHGRYLLQTFKSIHKIYKKHTASKLTKSDFNIH